MIKSGDFYEEDEPVEDIVRSWNSSTSYVFTAYTADPTLSISTSGNCTVTVTHSPWRVTYD